MLFFQSDRLVDLLLPVDHVIGLLAQAVDSVNSNNNNFYGNNINSSGAVGNSAYPQIEELEAAAAAFDTRLRPSDDLAVKRSASVRGEREERVGAFSGGVPQGERLALFPILQQ